MYRKTSKRNTLKIEIITIITGNNIKNEIKMVADIIILVNLRK